MKNNCKFSAENHPLKIRPPTTTAAMTGSRTAPAATSFASLMLSSSEEQTRSASISTAVFIPSAAITRPKQTVSTHHSTRESQHSNPAVTVNAAMMTCMRKLCSLKSRLIPANANLKLAHRLRQFEFIIKFFRQIVNNTGNQTSDGYSENDVGGIVHAKIQTCIALQ